MQHHSTVKFCCNPCWGPHSILMIIWMFPMLFEVTLWYLSFIFIKAYLLGNLSNLNWIFLLFLKRKVYWLIFLLLAEGIIASRNWFYFVFSLTLQVLQINLCPKEEKSKLVVILEEFKIVASKTLLLKHQQQFPLILHWQMRIREESFFRRK